MTFKQTPRNAAHDFGHTLGTNKNAREVRAFPDVWILGGAHTAGRESCRNDTNHQRQRATTHRRTRFRRWLLRRTKQAPPEARKPARKGRFLEENRASPPSPQSVSCSGCCCFPSRSVSLEENRRELAGSSVIGCGRWRAYGADSTIAEIQVDHRGPRLLGALCLPVCLVL